MDTEKTCPLAADLASCMREARTELTEHWLERITAPVTLSADHTPSADDLLSHVPVLMDGIADCIENPDGISADAPVTAAAIRLGELRFSQGFDASEVLREYGILGDLLYAFCARVVARSERECSTEELLICSHRLFRAVNVIEQTATAHHLRMLSERVAEREERLRRFSRMITHELKNRVGATLGAGQLLREDWLGQEQRARFAGIVEQNAQAIQKVLENLTVLARIDERRRQRNIPLREVVSDVFRHLRDIARAREVELRIAGELPDVAVNAAAVELCLSNYLSNAIKYSDGTAAVRWAEVSARVDDQADESDGLLLTVHVRDNGIGVPAAARDQLYERFFRAHANVVAVEGTGLGLNLVQETVETLGGRAWAEFDGGAGSVFAFSLPLRRDDDAAVQEVTGSGAAAKDAGAHRRDAAPARVSD